jgi:hypothetical protein
MRVGALLLFVSTGIACGTGAVSVRRASGTAEPSIMRVRSSGDDTVAVLLHDAFERSATFRQLVETIGHTNGLVYVDSGKCKPGFAACLLMSVKVAGPNRLLRIVVETHRKPPEVMASIGHELQHAIEALSEPGVTNNALMEQFFERLTGSPTARGQLEFETSQAVKVGDMVLTEVTEWLNRRASSR